MKLIILVFGILVAVIIALVVDITIDWRADIDTTKYETGRSGWVNYRQFVKEFNKRKWKIGRYGRLHCLNDENSLISLNEGIIKFNNIGMLMRTPISHERVKRFIKKQLGKWTDYQWPKDVV